MSTEGIDKQSPEVAEMAKNWPMISALVGGTAAMRAAGTAFMPKWPAEDQGSYDARIKTATLFPAFSRTCSIMAAKPFAKAIGLDETKLPPQTKSYISDVDMYGTDLSPYLASLFLGVMQSGLMGVLVDCPPANNVATLEDEKKAGIRPYMASYPASSILGWRSTRDAKGPHLTQLRLMEAVNEPDGEFGDKQIKQIRVLTPGAWKLYRESETLGSSNGKKEWILHNEGTTSLKRIPFVFFYGVRTGFGSGFSPLLDLAFLNVEHWQSSSDQQTIVHVARIPVLFAKGFGEKDKITIGASTACMASSVDANLMYVEHSGAAVEAGRQSLLDLEDRMRQTGAELLVKRQRGSVATATEVRFETEGNKSTLQKIVEDFEESAEACLSLMAEWKGETFDGDIDMFKDFDAGGLASINADLLLRAIENRVVSRETAFAEFKRLDVLSPDVQWDEEDKRIADDPPPPPDPGSKIKPATE